MSRWSWDQIQFEWNIVGPHKMELYSTKNCDATTWVLPPPYGRMRSNNHAVMQIATKLTENRHRHNCSDYDYWIYWLPKCSQPNFQWGGFAEIGGGMMVMRGPFPYDYFGGQQNQTTLYSAGVAHEMGHLFGNGHASCINNNNRGSVAWCDSHVKEDSLACNMSGAVSTEYCSSHSIMGETFNLANTWKHRPYFVLGRITSGWADPLGTVLVKKIDFDHARDRYTDCDPSCTFRLQRSDAETLDKTATVVTMLQTTHSSSTGDRYFVFEHRLNNSYTMRSTTPVLLLHSTDVQRIDRPSGVYGNIKRTFTTLSAPSREGAPLTALPMARTYGQTYAVDCTPKTRSWDDAGCALGQSIVLDAGREGAPMKMRVYIHPALGRSGKLTVTLSRVGAAA